MKYRIGDAITGFMILIQQNIGNGINHIRCLMSGEHLAMKYSSVKNLLSQSLKDTNRDLINLYQKKINELNINRMPVKPPSRPIDAIRGLFEEQQLQINDLTQVIKNQSEKIKRLEDKHKEILKKESESKSWFFA